MATIKNNVGFAFSPAFKMMLVTFIIGLAIAIGKSYAFWGIIILSAAYFSYACVAACVVGVVGFISSLFAKTKADKDILEDVVAQKAAQGATRASYVRAEDSPAAKPTPSDAAAAAKENIEAFLANLSPEDAEAMLAALLNKGDNTPPTTTKKK